MISLAAMLACPAFAGTPRDASARRPWLEPVPRADRAPLVSSLQRLIAAEQREDWDAVYQLRPDLDRQTETEPQFARRWQEITPGKVLDFAPFHTVPSTFASEAPGEQVFDILGCTRVSSEDGTISQEGSVSAHLQDGKWYLDGVHLMATDDDAPEPCTFHPDGALLQTLHRKH